MRTFNEIALGRSPSRIPQINYMPMAVGNAIFVALGASTTSVAAIWAVGFIATTAATSFALKALAPKIDMSGLEGMQANQRSAVASREYVYGQVRKGGTITYMESTGVKNKYLHMVLVLAGHELSEINDIYINDEIVTLDAEGFATGDTWKSKVRIKKHLGDQTTADAALLGESEQIDSAFVGNGCAYLYIRLEYDSDVFANGIPLFTAIVKGAKVYDPREPSNPAAYSNNPALCIRHYLTSAYGLGDTSSEIDDVAFAVAAHICDDDIALAVVGTQNQYEMNGVVSASMTFGDALSKMLSACAGTLFWGGGKWQLKPGYYSTPTASFTLDDLRGPISGSPRANMRDSFNSVRGKFNDADQDWITVDYPEIASTVFLAEDNGFKQPLDLELPFTTSSPMAQRLAKITLYRARDAITFSADFGLSALSTQIGDTVALTIDRYGWSEKTFEVTGWKFYANQDAGDLRVNLVLREISASSFDWDADETEIVSNNTSLPVFNVVPAVSNLSLTATSVLNDDGVSIPAITAAWDVSNDSFVEYYEIQYKRSDSNFFSTISTINTFTVAPVLNGYDYEVRVRAINAVGVKSPWVTSSIASEGDTTPPNEALSLTCVGGYKFINIGWTNPADQDLSHVEIWESATSNLAVASLIGTSASSNFMRPNLGNNVTKFYWVRAVDLSLNKSGFTGPQSATTILVDVDDFTDAVNDLFGEAGAFGIEPVSSLPATGGFDGQLVLLLSEVTIYRWDAATSSWSTDIYTASSVEAGTITYASFAAGIEPVGVVDALPTVAGYGGPVIVVLTTDGKLYRLVDGAWTAAVNTDDIEGTIGENLFSDDLRPVERVGSLPSTDLTQGRIVLLTTDNKMYRYTGSEWTAAVPATDLSGQITETQISDNAITTTKIAANAVTATTIDAGAITAAKISAGAVSADAIAANAITSVKIAADAITAGKIAANAVEADAITANAITTGKIAAGAVSADQIAANAVVADKIFASAVTADKIATDAVTANKIAAASIIASKIAAGAVTAAKMRIGDFVNYAENADFELGDDAWDTGQGGFTIEADSNFYAGSYSLRRTTTLGTTDFCVNDFQFSAAPGDQFNVSAYVKVSATYGGGGVGVGIRWFQSDGTFISSQQSNITATTAWQKVEANLTAPALAAYGVGQCRNVSQTAGTAYWDNFTLLKKQSGAALIVSGTIEADQLKLGTASLTSDEDGALVLGDIQSDTYTTGVDGWRIKRDGSAEFNDVVISRPLVLNNGSFVYSGGLSSGGTLNFNFVNSGIRIGDDDVWANQRVALIAVARAVPSSASNVESGSLWRAKADVYNSFRWNGSNIWDAADGLQYDWSKDPATLVTPDWSSGLGQRVLMDIEIKSSLITMNGPITIYWKVYQVT
jgi:hypothetical protein